MTTPNMKIFISYRRSDHPGFVERIRDWFLMRYGRENVFMDYDSIPSFVEFADFIRNKIREHDVVVAIIGPRWIELLREKALQFEEDFVRAEIELALQENKLIAPICIQGAKLPAKNDMPRSLHRMLDYNVAHLSEGKNFIDHIPEVMDAIQDELKRRIQPTSIKEMGPVEYFNRGYQRNQTDIEGKIADYTKAIELNPEFAEALSNRGEFYFHRGDYELALADFKAACDITPGFPYAVAGLAVTNYVLGNVDEAQKLWRLLINLDTRYQNTQLAGKILHWAPVLVNHAQKLVETL